MAALTQGQAIFFFFLCLCGLMPEINAFIHSLCFAANVSSFFRRRGGSTLGQGHVPHIHLLPPPRFKSKLTVLT